MIRLNYGYGYSKKYQDFVNQQQHQFQPKQNITDRSKKLSIENKKRRRQFEERQRIHERNEQKRREEALNSRRRRQQDATNAYKAALSKELSKRNRTPISRTTSASSVASAVPCRPPYRSPTVDEVLSSIRGQGLAGSGGSGAKPPRQNYYSPKPPGKGYHAADNSLEARLEMIYRSPPRETNRCETVPSTRHGSDPTLRSGDPLTTRTEYFASPSKGGGESSKARVDFTTYTEPKSYRTEVTTAPRPPAPAPTVEVPRREDPPAREEYRREMSYNDYLRDSLETMPEPTSKDEDRIRVQIDLTKFEQLDVSDCESIEAEPPPMTPAPSKQQETIATRQFFEGSSNSDLTAQGSSYTMHSGEEESQIIAKNDVEAIKVAASRTSHAWTEDSKSESEKKVPIKSLIKRTPSAKRKQVRWDSVSALDDHTMEIDQFDISAEGEAVFTCQYTHSRPPSAAGSYQHLVDTSPQAPTFDPHRTPTDAEINALWNKVRTTLHRNQAWEGSTNTPSPSTSRPQTANPRSYDYRGVRMGGARAIQVTGQPVLSRHSDHEPSHHHQQQQNNPGGLSMEEQRILQSLERLDAKLKTTDTGMLPVSYDIVSEIDLSGI
eukprot:sb/3463150/